MGEKIIDNDGYYQQLDEDRFDLYDFNRKDSESYKPRPYVGAPQGKYSSINQTDFTRKGRRNFCAARHAIHKQAEQKYHQDIQSGSFSNIPRTHVFKQCSNCKGGMIAKKADIKRGWGRFCSKSCKAQH